MKTSMMTLMTCIAIAASQLVGCGDTLPQDEAIASFDAELVWVDAEMMDSLNEGEHLVLDLNEESVVYAVNLTEVDPSRIEVRDVNQPTMVLSNLIDQQSEVQGYGDAALERIVLTARLENFASLAPWELEVLYEEGYYQAETELMQGADEALATVEGSLEIYFRIFGWGVCIKIEKPKDEDAGSSQSGGSNDSDETEEADESKGTTVTFSPIKSDSDKRGKK